MLVPENKKRHMVTFGNTKIKKNMGKESLKHQPYGNHYLRYKVQPIELIAKKKWNFFQGNIAKYVLRAKHKNGMQDIDKAIHYCRLAIDLDDENVHHVIDGSINRFIIINDLPYEYKVVLMMVDHKSYRELADYLSDTEYIEKNISVNLNFFIRISK